MVRGRLGRGVRAEWWVSSWGWIAIAVLICRPLTVQAAGTLTGSFTSIPSGSNVNLTVLGTLDWVQWGLGGDYVVNRKAAVTALISNFTLLSQNSPGNPMSFSSPYWLQDPTSSYFSWSDGQPMVSITTNYTAVMAYSYPVRGGSGFRITVPADTKTNVLTVYVGSLSARGTLRASLSAQLVYTHSPVGENVNGAYTLVYAAAAPGQTLTVEWTLPSQATNGYVTLRAAALTAPGANNPPFAVLTTPTNDTVVAAPADISLEASAEDFDGAVTNVAFYADSTRLGESATAPYQVLWNNPPIGHHVLTAVATDEQGTSRASMPVDVFVYGTSGSQTGLREFPAAAVDLTAEGTSDWVHWGLLTNTSINRKSGVAAQISDFTQLGTSNVTRYADNYAAFSWSDGTPTAAVYGTPTGVYIRGLTNGFSLTAPADTSARLLKLYLGAYAARGHLLAYLSDFSGKPYIDTIYDPGWDNEYAVISLTYAAGSAGQQLIVIYRSVELLDGVWGNLTLQAATLAASAANLLPVTILDPVYTGSDFRFSFSSQTGCNYAIQASGAVSPADWTTLTTVPGTGSTITVTNALQPAAQNFYRVITQSQ